jgi:hypothetical protein
LEIYDTTLSKELINQCGTSLLHELFVFIKAEVYVFLFLTPTTLTHFPITAELSQAFAFSQGWALFF